MYTLAEKYTLSEKIYLSETYTLTEAVDPITMSIEGIDTNLVSNLSSALNALLVDASADNPSAISAAITKLNFSGRTDLMLSIKNKLSGPLSILRNVSAPDKHYLSGYYDKLKNHNLKSFAIVANGIVKDNMHTVDTTKRVGRIKEFLSQFGDLAPKIATEPSVARYISELYRLAGATETADENAVNELDNKFKDFSNALTDAVKTHSATAKINWEDVDIKKVIAYLNDLKSEGEASLITLSAKYKIDSSKKNAVEELIQTDTQIIVRLVDTLKNLGAAKNKTSAAEVIELISKCKKAIMQLSILVKRYGETVTASGGRKLFSDIWNERYAKIKSAPEEEQEQFWDDYYKSLVGPHNRGKIEELKLLTDTLQVELETYGFKLASNPFLVYLLDVERTDGKKGMLGDIDFMQYKALHNAVAEHVLSIDDIKGTGWLEKDNVALKTSALDLNVNDFSTLLKLQQLLISNCSLKGVPGSMSIKFGRDAKKLAKAVLYLDSKYINIRPIETINTNINSLWTSDAIKVTDSNMHEVAVDLKAGLSAVELPMLAQYIISMFINLNKDREIKARIYKKYKNLSKDTLINIDVLAAKNIPDKIAKLDKLNASTAEKLIAELGLEEERA